MKSLIQTVRGMQDILPVQTCYWAELEAIYRKVMLQYAYQEIRFPIVESTALFKRGIGEVTDIVEKEMYTFEDRNGDSLTLRPEGTAGCVRAANQGGLLYNQVQRLWYAGPMFRHERPQKGRYRQFHQLGVEAYGMAGPQIDVEVIMLSARLLADLGLISHVRLQLNTLGTQAARAEYRKCLVDYFAAHQDRLDEDSRRRLHSNPLRILDSKNSAMQPVIADAPKIINSLDSDSQQHFDKVCELLTKAGISFEYNPTLVRGLDYYSSTVFEWVTESLGSQGTVCAGGRYDGLVEQLGGRPTPAVGFACGLERLVLMLAERRAGIKFNIDVYIVLGPGCADEGLAIAESLRNALPHLTIATGLGNASIKGQFKRANNLGARFALVLAADEIARQVVTLKDLQSGEQQRFLPVAKVIDLLKN